VTSGSGGDLWELRARQAGAGEVGEVTGELLHGQALSHGAAGGYSPGGGGGQPAGVGMAGGVFYFIFINGFFLVDIQIIYFLFLSKEI
jgi:hypothetical protein